jgi:hypothetical protein
LRLHNDAGTENVRINTNGDSWFKGGDVGIGAAPAGERLVVKSSAAGADTIVRVLADDGGNCVLLGKNATDDGQIGIHDGSEVKKIHLDANGDSYFTGGDVSIGTAVATGQKLTVEGNIEARSGSWFISRSTDNASYAYIKNPTTSDAALGFFVGGEKMRINSTGGIELAEAADAASATAAKGQIWVKNDAPNTLWFTDDANNDKQIDTAEIGIACSDETTALETGDNKATVMIPRKMVVTEVKASLTAADTDASGLDIDVRYHATDPTNAGATILNADLNIAQSAFKGTTTTFASSATSYTLAEDGFIMVDINGPTTPDAKGLKIWLLGYWTK